MASRPHLEYQPTWSGTLTFGLVSVPVGLVGAARGLRPRIHRLDAKGRPLRRRYVCPRDGAELEPDDLVRAYELPDGRLIPVTDAELEDLEPQKSREIDLRTFVDRDRIDPLLLDQPYLLVPEGGSNKAYRLLARAMEEEGKAGIATFILRAKESLVAVMADDGILTAMTLQFPDEVRDPEEIGLPARKKAAEKDVARLARMITAHALRRAPVAKLEDTYREKLEALIARKRKAGKIVRAASDDDDEAQDAKIVDLVAILKKRLRGKRR